MPVVISPNIKKESVRIDPSGNVINPRTKQIEQAIEPEYIPPVLPDEISTIAFREDPNGTYTAPQAPTANQTSKIDDMISKKIEEVINRKIEEALSKL